MAGTLPVSPPSDAPGSLIPVSRGRAPTIHDVARRAGVATSTVSRALAGQTRISSRTRERVAAAARDLGYRPSRSARALRAARTSTLALVFPSLENPIAIEQLGAAVRAAYRLGYTVFVSDTQGSPDIQDSELDRLLEHRVDGAILGRGVFLRTPGLVAFLASGIPVEPEIAPDSLLGPDPAVALTPYAEPAELDGPAALAGFRHLVRHGHHRLAFVTRSVGPTDLGLERRRALHQALAEGTVDPTDTVHVAIDDPRDCAVEIQRVAAMGDRPTAVIAASGLLTPYILEGIATAGLRIPADVSFLAFGDSAWHRGYTPPLSVVRHDYAAAAERTVRRLIARIEGEPVPDIPLRPPEFVPRASTGPAPGGIAQP